MMSENILGARGLPEALAPKSHGGKSAALKKGKISPTPPSALVRLCLEHRGRFWALHFRCVLQVRRHSEDSKDDPGLGDGLQKSDGGGEVVPGSSYIKGALEEPFPRPQN